MILKSVSGKTSSGNKRKDIQVHFIRDGRLLEIHLALILGT